MNSMQRIHIDEGKEHLTLCWNLFYMFLSKRLKHLKSNTLKKQIFIPFFATNLQNLQIMCAISVTFQVQQ
jgi:hypothetical protein